MRLCSLISGRGRERETLTSCLPYAPCPGITHETQGGALARDGIHNILIYWPTLQLTGPPGLGSHLLSPLSSFGNPSARASDPQVSVPQVSVGPQPQH